MEFEQFTYTGSPWGFSAPGWTIFQSSPGISPQEAVGIKPYFQFKNPVDGVTPDTFPNGTPLPVQLVFATLPGTKRRFVSQSLDSGLRWYDQTRGRDYFAHVFVESVAGSGLDEVSLDFNPVAWFLSRSFQTEFPTDLRDKALEIFRGETPNEPTPELPTVPLSDIHPAEELTDSAIFGNLSDKTASLLGPLISAMIRKNRGEKKKVFAFDGTKNQSLFTMAACVRLLPLSVRQSLSFSTWIPPGDLRSFPESEDLLFVGTFRAGETADPDTGLYGPIPQGGPEFKSREDVESFKEMVDICGSSLRAEDFDELVACWEVASGKTGSLDRFRETATFAGRFPGLEDRLAESLSDAGREFFLVGWFELGLNGFRDVAEADCAENARDGDTFAQAFRTLKTPAARSAFLDSVYESCRQQSDKADFVRTWLSLERDVRALKPEGSAPWNEGVSAAEEFERIRDAVRLRQVKESDASVELDVLARIETVCGTDLEAFDETKRKLEYLIALACLRSPSDLPAFAERAKALGGDSNRIRAEVLAHVKPETLRATDNLDDALAAYEVVGISGAEVLGRVLVARESAENERKQNRPPAMQPPGGQSRRSPSRWAIFLGMVSGFVIGAVAGAGTSWVVISGAANKPNTSTETASETKPDASTESPWETVVEETQPIIESGAISKEDSPCSFPGRTVSDERDFEMATNPADTPTSSREQNPDIDRGVSGLYSETTPEEHPFSDDKRPQSGFSVRKKGKNNRHEEERSLKP